MKFLKIIFALLIISLVINSCRKKDNDLDDDKNEDQKPVPKWETTTSTPAVLNFLRSKAPAFVSFNISGEQGGTISSNGIKIIFSPNSFVTSNGSVYTGTVNVKMKTIRKVSEMIYSGVTTTSGGELLLSDGMFKLEAYDNANNALNLRPNYTYSSEITSTTANEDSRVFWGEIRGNNDNNTVEWVWANDSSFVESVKGIGDTTISYLWGLNKMFTWCNLDRFMNETPLTNITIKTPEGFTNTNTVCALIYTGEVTGGFIPADIDLKVFSTQNYWLKVVQGRGAKIICSAFRDNKVYYKLITVNAITENQVITIDTMDETTEAGLIQILENL
jgi:hypothetical protein